MKSHANVELEHKQDPILLHIWLALRGKSLDVLHEANVICLAIAHFGVFSLFDDVSPWLAYRNALRDHRLQCSKSKSLICSQRQSFFQDFFKQRTAINLEYRLPYFLDKVSFALASEGTLSMQHLIQDESKAPNITFFTVNIMQQRLRRHVKRSAQVEAFLDFFTSQLCAVLEISNLRMSILHEDVIRLEITMNVTLSPHQFIPSQDLQKDSNGFSFLKPSASLDPRCQCFLAQLSHEIRGAVDVEVVMVSQDVGMIIFPQEVGLLLCQICDDVIQQRHYLDGNRLFGDRVDSFIDGTVGSFANWSAANEFEVAK